MTEFKAFPKIKHLKDLKMSITQKIHGTNAHILVFENEAGEMDLKCGSRNRYVTPDNDNYGFATFVYEHKQEFIDKLGPGRHDGEWCGLGVNSGEGLDKKWFLLFDWWRRPEERSLPPQTGVVPLLYQGGVDLSKIDEIMEDLKTNGSKLSPGFMRPEGIVVMINGDRFKKVFLPEDTKWTGGDPNKVKVQRVEADYSHLCQPVRLEKLISKDENYSKNYPKSLGLIVKDYMADLIEEGEIKGDADEIKGITKGASGQVFRFIREVMES